MKHVIMAKALIPACFIFACGTKKEEKKVPLVIETRDSEATIISPVEASRQCSEDAACEPLNPGEMLVLQRSSWLNPEQDEDGTLQDHDGVCLDEFTAGAADAQLRASVELKLRNMALQKKDEAHCRAQIRVAYARGYAFAIRKVEVPLMGEIPVDSQAVFSGSYGIKGKKPLVMQKALDSRYSGKSLRIEHSVANEDIVWSDCSGEATLILDSEISMNFNGSAGQGGIRIETSSPYRLEVVWAKCL